MYAPVCIYIALGLAESEKNHHWKCPRPESRFFKLVSDVAICFHDVLAQACLRAGSVSGLQILAL